MDLRAAWFAESLATQGLVTFAKRTRSSGRGSSEHPPRVASSLGAFAEAVGLPFTPAGAWVGFLRLRPTALLAPISPQHSC